MANKKQIESFNKKVIKLILEREGKTLDVPAIQAIQCQIDTNAGVWDITLHKDKSEIYSIFSRFEDVDKANEFINKGNYNAILNNWSAKFNLHRMSADLCLRDFTEDLMKLTEK